MIFAMLRIRALRQAGGSGSYSFETSLMEQGGSSPIKTIFHSEGELFDLLGRILQRQTRWRETRVLPEEARREPCYFFDVELTREHAEELGWNLDMQLEASDRSSLTGNND